MASIAGRQSGNLSKIGFATVITSSGNRTDATQSTTLHSFDEDLVIGNPPNPTGYPLRGSGASMGTVAAICDAMDDSRKEEASATSARCLRSAGSYSSRSDEGSLAGFDCLAVDPPDIAAVAGGHEIFGAITSRIIVDVVNDQGLRASIALGPRNGGAAPVAAMGSNPDFVEQYFAMERYLARAARERVSWRCDVGIANRGHAAIVSRSSPFTDQSAELRYQQVGRLSADHLGLSDGEGR